MSYFKALLVGSRLPVLMAVIDSRVRKTSEFIETFRSRVLSWWAGHGKCQRVDRMGH